MKASKEKPKVIAWHLPQFHEIPENNEWWGKGFTEWVNVKKARPLFRNHYQPRIPLNDNYYDLSKKSVLEWQAQLAKQYGIYGFCFYQYWFNGEKLLETPIENLHNWIDIDINYCLSWANEPWTRAWDGGEKDILMPQFYGGEEEWAKHFDYLKPFFGDSRYIKVGNKPVYLIYRCNNIPAFDDMASFWNKKAIELGFDGVYIVETLNGFQKTGVSKISAASVYMEPMYTIAWDKPFWDRISNYARRICMSKLRIFNYKSVWNQILKRPVVKDVFPGAFVDWDNSARKKNATIFKGSNPILFSRYLEGLMAKNTDSEFIFINAWNEWAEGTYLEPDECHGYAFLEGVKKSTLC